MLTGPWAHPETRSVAQRIVACGAVRLLGGIKGNDVIQPVILGDRSGISAPAATDPTNGPWHMRLRQL